MPYVCRRAFPHGIAERVKAIFEQKLVCKRHVDEKYEKGRPSTCGGHVGVARVGGVVPLQWMMRYRACWEVGPWVRVTWLCDLVKSDSHFAIVIHSWMAVLIHSWMVLLMIF